MKPRAIVSEMDSYVPGKSQDEIASEFNLNKDDIIKLGSNENPFGPSAKAIEAIGKELEQTYYQTESILENLDKKILEYVEENKAYARPNTRMLKTIENLQKERTDLHKTLKQVEKEMLYYDKSVDRYEDYQQKHTKNKSQHSPRL